MKQTSIGLRLALWYAALLAAALGVFAALAYWQLRRAVFESADGELTRVASGAEKVVRQHSRPADRAELSEELNEFADELGPGIALDVWMDGQTLVHIGRPAHAHGHAYRGLTREFVAEGGKAAVHVELSIRSGLDIMRTYRRLAAICAPVMLLFSCCAGYWISRRALRPVDAITQSARSIGVLDLSERLKVPRTNDELHRLAEAWNEMLDRLEKSMQRLSRFSADASHEMRSPLAVIGTTAELALRRERSVDEYQAALAGIGKQVDRLSSLVEDLLALARAEQDPSIRFSAVDLSSVVQDARGVLEPLARAKNIEIAVDAPVGVPPIKAHEPSVRRLILILLDNAIKFAPPGGHVAMRIRLPGQSAIELAVEDDGPGIADADLPHIFERFYRADAVRTPGATGTGLGLSLARSIAEAHRTRIEVETTGGKGSVFKTVFSPWTAQI